MEKISNIVRGNSRVSSVDLKSASAVRPGAPSFGRAIGASPASTERETTTASRAVALHNAIVEKRRNEIEDRVVSNLADKFFMSRARRPEETEAPAVEVVVNPSMPQQTAPIEDQAGKTVPVEAKAMAEDALPEEQPEGYTPRGSFVDVRA